MHELGVPMVCQILKISRLMGTYQKE